MKLHNLTIGTPMAILIGCLLIFAKGVSAQVLDQPTGEVLSQYEKKLSTLATLRAPFANVQTFSFEFDDTPFHQALDEIAEKGRLRLLVNHELLDEEYSVSKRFENVNLREAFEGVLAETSLDFMVAGNGYIIIIPKLNYDQNELQDEVVTGRVSDTDTGESIPGVNIVVKGTSQGTTTDSNGFYELQVPSLQDTLVFSFIGYQSLEVPINDRTEVDATLETLTYLEDEIVVVGYGNQRRETITGSIATVQAEEFNAGIISDPITLITGKVAGLSITRPNGSDPNATADFSLRGVVSIEGNSQPLIVIDGVPGGDLRTIAPQDIESIDVLKDGSAAAIYGSRATGGVILVTTKRGQQGATRISYSGYTSIDQITKQYEMLTAQQFRDFKSQYGQVHDQGADTDWFSELVRDDAVSHGHNLSFSGGVGSTTYFGSLNYQDFQGIDLVSSREFINGTFRLNTRAMDDRLGISLRLTNSNDTRDFAEYFAFGQALSMNPTWPVYDEDGSYFERPGLAQGQMWNPVANTHLNTNESKERRVLGSVNLTYSILSNMTANVSYSYTYQEFLSGNYTDNRLQYMQTSGLNGQASRNQSNTTNNIIETTLEYGEDFRDHSFNFLGGYSYQNIFNEGFGAGNNNFNTNSYLYHNLGAGSAINNLDPQTVRDGVFVSSFASERSLVAFFGRVTYDFKDRYLLNASIRREGASALGRNNKWGTFTGISAGWIITNESFMDNVGFLQNLKIRAGYGVTGNQEGLAPYMSLARMGPLTRWSPPDWSGRPGHAFLGTPGNHSWIQVSAPTDNPNDQLRWEIKKEFNAGIDFTLFESGRLNGSLEFYDRKIEDLLGNFVAQKPSNIHDMIFANAGEMQNRGVELMLDATLISNNRFRWNTTFTGAKNTNEIISVSNDQFFGSAHDITEIEWLVPVQRLAPGQPVNAFYGRVFAGFDDDGGWLFENKDGEIVGFNETTDDDFAFLGNSIPRWNLALTNTINYGRWDATILLRSALDFNALNAKRIYHENVNSPNLFTSALDNPARGETIFSSYYLEKGDYLKIDNITIGYTFPFNNLRVYATANNLAVFTGFSGMDPELGINPFSQVGSSFGAGVEFNDNYYPRTRTFTVGLSVEF